jgi:HSP20 family protein
MTEQMTRNNPFGGMTTLQEAINQLLADSFVQPGRWSAGNSWTALDVYETEATYVARLAVPGLKPEDFDITVQQNTLTISGKVNREEPEGAHYLVREQAFGEFTRSIQFACPVDVEKVQASLSNGILTVTTPKAENARPRRINVNAS